MSDSTLGSIMDVPASTRQTGRRFSPLSALMTRGESLGWMAAAVATVVLGLEVIGIPGLAILAGAWLLSAALHYGASGIAGPAAWAGGIIAEVCLLGAGSAGLALLSPHTHGTAVNLAVLLAPAVLGGVLLGFALLHHRNRPDVSRNRGRYPLAVTVQLAVLAVAGWIGSDRWHGVSWAMSGDARNHVILMRSILSDGGLSLSVLRAYPALVDGIASLISGGGHRVGLAPGTLMIHDAQAVATTYVLAAIGMGCALVATLAELLPAALALRRRLPAGVIVTMLVSAATVGTPLVLGTSIRDGYISAYGSLPIAVAACALAVRFYGQPAPITLALLGPAAIATLLGWTVLGVVPAALLAVALVLAVVHVFSARTEPLLSRASIGWMAAIVVAAGSLLGMAGVVISHLVTLRKTFAIAGSITSPQPKTLPLLGLLLIGMIAITRDGRLRRQLLGPLVAVLAGLATVHWLQTVAHSPVPTYYSAKSLYLIVCALVWVPFALIQQVVVGRTEAGTHPATDPTQGYQAADPPEELRAARLPTTIRGVGQPAVIRAAGKTRLRTRSLGPALSALAWSLAVIAVLNLVTTLGNPLTRAHDGLFQPSAAVVKETTMFANQGKPFLLWNWSDPGDERLANFWAFATWDTAANGRDKNIGTTPALPGGVFYWAYVESGSPADLCSITTAIPGLVVVTANRALKSTLHKSCPKARPKIVVQPYPG